MAYTTIDDPSVFFQCTLYVGNNSTQTVTHGGNSDLQADFIWGKARDDTAHSFIIDSIRGVSKRLRSSGNTAEATVNTGITAIGSDSFAVGNDGDFNDTNINYVTWNWKAGTAFSNDASSTSIGSIDSSGSVNNDAGFSIVSWTGTGSAATIKHGLSTVPKMIMIKNLDSAEAWPVYHVANTSAAETEQLYLNLTNATADSASQWNDTAPTSSIFTVGSSTESNKSSSPMIAYCFSEKQGYSKFGSYVGNGNANGTFVYTGFKPAWFVLKKTSATDPWLIYDNKRSPINQVQANLQANSTNAEVTNTVYLDFLSNGVKFRNTDNDGNLSGGTYVYFAFAENPFVTSTGVPATAR